MNACKWFVVGCALLTGCGGGAVSRPSGTTFSAEQELLFDNGVDFVADPEIEDSAWSDAWARALQARLDDAQVIAFVNAATVRTDTNPRGENSYRLQVSVDRWVKGQLGSKELNLVSSPKDPGYTATKSNFSRALGAKFVVFLRWREGTDDGPDVLHWHASVLDDTLRTAVLRGAP
ncbi:MAG: hypothetical protein R3A78_01420 [Polyangiales bacterium]